MIETMLSRERIVYISSNIQQLSSHDGSQLAEMKEKITSCVCVKSQQVNQATQHDIVTIETGQGSSNKTTLYDSRKWRIKFL